MARQDAEVIAVQRDQLVPQPIRKPATSGIRYNCAYGAFEFVVGLPPVQSIVPALTANKSLGILRKGIGVVWLGVVLLLRSDEPMTDPNGRQFILADSSEQDFRSRGVGIEEPRSRFVHEWNRRRPILCTDV